MRNLILIIALFMVLLVFGFAIAYQSQTNQSPPANKSLSAYPQYGAMNTSNNNMPNSAPNNMSNTTMPGIAMPNNMSNTSNIMMPTMSNNMLNIPSNGNIKVVMPHLTITNLNGPSIDASDIVFTNIYDIKSKVENHRHVELIIRNLQISGAPIPINGSVNLSFNLDNVNLEAIQKIMLLSKSMQAKDSTPEQNKQAFAQMMQILPEVVTNTSNVTVDEAYNTTQGAMTSNYKIYYPSNLPLPSNATELSHNIKGSVLIKIATTLFDSYLAIFNSPSSPDLKTQTSSTQNQQMQNALFIQQMFGAMIKQNLDNWIKQGYIIKDKNDYIFSLTYVNGIFRINGKVFDPSQFTPPLSAMPTMSPPAPTMTPAIPLTPAIPAR